MQLRPCPVSVRDVCNWPPRWVLLGQAHSKAKTATGEIGILKHARYYRDRCGRIYLTVHHGGVDYVGCMTFKNPGLCEIAFEHLRHCYGMSIDSVGSSELP